MPSIVSIVGVFIAVFCTVVSAGNLSQSQITGLYYFYNSTAGNDWVWNANESGVAWNFVNETVNPCLNNWQGITCSSNCTTTDICNITGLNLLGHNLRGSIPTEIVFLDTLEQLNLDLNSITGSIPSTFTNLRQLNDARFYINFITGVIPTDIGVLTKLTYLDFGTNRLTSTLPPGLSLLSQLTVLYSDDNFFTSTVPDSFQQLSDLKLLQICLNMLSSTIPSGLSTKLTVLNLHDNSFTYIVPSMLSSFSHMQLLNLENNQFEESLEQVVFAPSMLFLYLGNNLFTGRFPFEASCALTGMQRFYINKNKFEGSLPSCIGQMTSLQVLNAASNSLTGTLPSATSSLYLLQSVLLSSNSLVGRLDIAFTNASYLTTLDVSDNDFTGSLPDYLFSVSPNLRTFMASKNCFSGTINSAVCSATALHTLSLSGLTAGQSCVSTAAMGVYFARSVGGSIPPCIFALPELIQVAIAGNGLVSSLPDIPAGSKLQNVSLSFNRLYGAIPKSIQERSQLRLLDLSFNRLSGTIEQMQNYSLIYNGNYGSAASDVDSVAFIADADVGSYGGLGLGSGSPMPSGVVLQLGGNRLSGWIPSVFSSTTSAIDILEGNLFNCHTLSSLPQADPYAKKYLCGSMALDALNYFYLGCLFASVVVASYACWWVFKKMNIQQNVKENENVQVSAQAPLHTEDESTKGCCWSWIQLTEGVEAVRLLWTYFMWRSHYRTGHVRIDFIASSLAAFRLLTLLVLCVVLVVMLPIFLTLRYGDFNVKYSTHSYTYGWAVSLGFMEYYLTGVIVTIAWFLGLAGLILYEYFYINKAGDSNPLLANTLKYVGVLSLASLAPDTSHGVLKLNRNSRVLLLLLFNALLVMFINGVYVYVVLTSSTVVRFFVSLLTVIFKLIWNNAFVIPRLDRLQCHFYTILTTMTFNNIFAPILVSMAVDISCFQSLFVPAQPIDSSYSVDQCTLYTGTHCDVYQPQTYAISFSPPFIYSNQCSSALLTTYVPLYLAIYGIVGLLVTVIQTVLLFYFLGPLSERKQKLLGWLRAKISLLSFLSNGIICNMVLPIRSMDDLLMSKVSEEESRLSHTNRHAMFIPRNYIKTFYKGRTLALNSAVIYALLLTFGVAYPPLAVILAINIVSNTLLLQLCIHYHYRQIQVLAAGASAAPTDDESRSSTCEPAATAVVDETISAATDTAPIHISVPASVPPSVPMLVTKEKKLLEVWSLILLYELKDTHKILFGSRVFIYGFSIAFAGLFVLDWTFQTQTVAGAVLIAVSIALTVGLLTVVKHARRLYPHAYHPSIAAVTPGPGPGPGSGSGPGVAKDATNYSDCESDNIQTLDRSGSMCCYPRPAGSNRYGFGASQGIMYIMNMIPQPDMCVDIQSELQCTLEERQSLLQDSGSSGQEMTGDFHGRTSLSGGSVEMNVIHNPLVTSDSGTHHTSPREEQP